jgi:hypothetical protein
MSVRATRSISSKPYGLVKARHDTNNLRSVVRPLPCFHTVVTRAKNLLFFLDEFFFLKIAPHVGTLIL